MGFAQPYVTGLRVSVLLYADTTASTVTPGEAIPTVTPGETLTGLFTESMPGPDMARTTCVPEECASTSAYYMIRTKQVYATVTIAVES